MIFPKRAGNDCRGSLPSCPIVARQYTFTIRVSPEASAGMLKNRGRIWIWYSDDARRIPVQMRARMFWGTLTFRLLRIEKK